MNKSLKLAVAAALLSVGAAAGAATTLPQTSGTIDILTGNGGFSFSAFDTSLGTLTGATVTFYSTINGNVFVENKGAAPASFTVGTGALLNLSIAGLNPVTVKTLYTTTVDLGARDSNIYDFAGIGGTTKAITSAVATNSVTFDSAAALNAFTSSGSIGGSFSGTFYGQGSGNVVFGSHADNVNTYAVLTYTYTPPVPEPETYGMLLAGLGLVGAIARRKAKKAA